jgi:hypothetical protein
MLDWDALIPSADAAAPSELGESSPKSGELPTLWETRLSFLGNSNPSDTKDRQARSPDSPSSPNKKQGMDTKPSTGGVGEGKTNCARETIFRVLGDLRTCDLCGNLTEGGRCDAAARREIVAMRGYEPVRDMPKRCEAYKPPPDDPDQRPGMERWPGLASP